jgi:hypothetical protein
MLPQRELSVLSGIWSSRYFLKAYAEEVLAGLMIILNQNRTNFSPSFQIIPVHTALQFAESLDHQALKSTFAVTDKLFSGAKLHDWKYPD